MSDARFLPSAGLLLAIAACAPEFATMLPASLESLATMTGWIAEGDAAPPPDQAGPDEA